MKAPSARVAMLLSIGGVLAAGSAAALVNSQVLDDQSSGAPASATAVSSSTAPPVTSAASTLVAPATTSATTAATVPTTAVVTVATAAPTVPPTSAATSAPTTAPAATAAVSTRATYRLGNAGTALLDTAGGRLAVVSVTPAAGWTVDRARSDGAAVEIRLESESGEVRFDASLVRGVVRVSLETDDDNSGSGGGGGDDDNSGSGSGDDDSSGSGSGGGGGDNSGQGSGDD
jgi:hypothetical protein